MEQRLATVADAFLHHDRPIVRPADDSVVRVIAGRSRPIRLGRGTAPLELELPRALPEPVLAVGGHLKLAVALAWGRRIVVSPHLGDMGTPRSEKVFGQVVADLQRLYDVQAARFLCDAHPGYATTRWVQAEGLPHSTVFHHRAHASALLMEHGVEDVATVFAWDGVGYGEDGTLWGGETFTGRPGSWRRTASLRSFRLPGGDKAGRSPWRSAAALAWEAGIECPVAVPDPIVREAWQRGLNAPRSSAAGRVFDAMSAIVLGVLEASFEGQGPMWLEARAGAQGEFPRLPVVEDGAGLPRIDWSPLVGWCADPRRSVGERASAVHLGAGRRDLQRRRGRARALGHRARRPHRRRVPEPAAHATRHGGAGTAGVPGAAARAHSLQRWRTRVRTGRRAPRAAGSWRRRIVSRMAPHMDGYTARMPWFERPFLWILRREYAGAMRFDEDDSADVMPTPPAKPCQLYVHVPFCEVLCPFCSFHRVRYNRPGRRVTSRRCAGRSASTTRPGSASTTCTSAAARRP